MARQQAKRGAAVAAGATPPSRQHRRIRLDAGKSQHYYLLTKRLSGPDSSGRSIEQLARTINAKHSYFGKVELNAATFASFIKNFTENTYGQDVYLDRAHNINDGVCGKIVRVFTQGDKLLAEIEWTPLGIKAFAEDGFKYFSIDFTDDYVHPETGKNHGALLFGAALTPRPFIKNMKPSEGPGRLHLSEGRTTFVPDYLQLNEGVSMNKFLEMLRKRFGELKLADTVTAILLAQFQAAAAAAGITEDETALAQLQLAAAAGAQQLAEHLDGKHSANHLNADAIIKLAGDTAATAVAAALDARDKAQKKLTEDLVGNRKLFTDAIDAAKGLSDTTKASLKKQSAELITAAMDADTIKRLADFTIDRGNELEIERKKKAIGLSAAGTLAQVEALDGLGSQVHGFMRERLMLTDSFGNKQLRLAEEKELTPFARKILALFDSIHGRRLEAEHKHLAGDGSTGVADGEFPVIAQRQVIVELLADLAFMAFVNTIVDPNAQAVMQIPFETRNVGNVTNGGRTYEGQQINYAGVSQDMELSYVTPRKIALLMSNEMIHFSRVAAINWDAWARNISSNARLMRDLICADIANELQRTADSFDAVAVANEVVTARVNGTRTVFKTVNFPVVRQYQPRDLKGNAVGTLENPITMTVAAAPVTEYDGTGNQAAGTYFQFTDLNLGYFRFVNELGAVQTLANTTATVITAYSYATNVTKVDTDTGAVDLDIRLNDVLNAVGDRKAILEQQRFVSTGFGISSATFNNTVTKARNFSANSKKNGTDTNGEGDLDQIKGVPMFKSNQPGVHLGDTRLIMGERGTLTYGVNKPFVIGAPFEVVHPTTGKPIGKKQAYGEEYSSIHVPHPIRNRLTSVIAYSAAARGAVG